MDLGAVKKVKCISNGGTYPGKFVVGKVYDVTHINKSRFDNNKLGQHDISINLKNASLPISGGFHCSMKDFLNKEINKYEHTGFIPAENETYDLY